jgi:hypothetical protein
MTKARSTAVIFYPSNTQKQETPLKSSIGPGAYDLPFKFGEDAKTF